MNRKFLYLLLFAGALGGCSQGPDFSEPVTIRYKATSYGVTDYELEYDQGNRGSGWGTVKFSAPVDFAEVGDTVVFKDGALVAIKLDVQP